MNNADEIIDVLGLEPHPEGGFFKQTFLDSDADQNDRRISSVIYYLLKYDQYSHWHRVDATESWFWHSGSPLVLTISPDGHDARTINLGPNISIGQRPHFVVQKSWWQTAISTGEWSLVSCMVTPAFSFDGFELAEENWRPVPRD